MLLESSEGFSTDAGKLYCGASAQHVVVVGILIVGYKPHIQEGPPIARIHSALPHGRWQLRCGGHHRCSAPDGRLIDALAAAVSTSDTASGDVRIAHYNDSCTGRQW